MRLRRAKLGNFGSYEHLEFDFSAPGLNLVQGATGSGKSTLFDAPVWILFGITAKDGSVDDVRSWNDLSLPTIGVLEVEIGEVTLHVTRVRGKPNENDLYFTQNDNETEHRGTNIKETQTLLNLRLGLDSSAYLAGAYFSEQGPSSSFFVSNATQRRALFDRISNLAFPTALADRLSIKISEAKKTFLKSQSDIVSLERQLLLIGNNLKDSTTRLEDWEIRFLNKVQELQDKSLSFNADKEFEIKQLEVRHAKYESERLKDLSVAELILSEAVRTSTCPTCGADTTVDFTAHTKKEIASIQSRENPYTYRLESARTRENVSDERLQDHLKQVNPFKAQMIHFSEQLQTLQANLLDEKEAFKALQANVQAYEQLKDLSGTLKEKLLSQSVDMIQTRTNEYLNKYFEGELSVEFIISGPNALEVSIFKNGHEAVYKQLSKGQRQLLKLSFSVAVMASVADRSGVHFTNLFFDEALDGLDSELKVKAFSLFSSLELDHESIFVIDHAEEFKSLFSKQYVVTIESDKSAIVDAEYENIST